MSMLMPMILMIIRRMLVLIFVGDLMISLIVWHCGRPLGIFQFHILNMMILFFLIIWKAFFVSSVITATFLLHSLTLCVGILKNGGTSPSGHP